MPACEPATDFSGGLGNMKIRVVVADDFPLVREGLVRALERDPGIEVVGQAENGREALVLAHEHQPDVIVLDLRMPEMGGIAVLERLREELPEVRAVIMTASEKADSLLDAVGRRRRRLPLQARDRGGAPPGRHHGARRRIGHHAGAGQPPAARVLPQRPRRGLDPAPGTGPARARRPAARRPGPHGHRDRQGPLRLPAHGPEPPHAHPREDRPAPPLRAHALGRRALDHLARSTGRGRALQDRVAGDDDLHWWVSGDTSGSWPWRWRSWRCPLRPRVPRPRASTWRATRSAISTPPRRWARGRCGCS